LRRASKSQLSNQSQLDAPRPGSIMSGTVNNFFVIVFAAGVVGNKTSVDETSDADKVKQQYQIVGYFYLTW